MLRFVTLLNIFQLILSSTLLSQNTDSLRRVVDSKVADSLKADAYYKLADVYYEQNSDSAILFYNDCIALTRKTYNDALRFRALKNLSSFYFNSSNFLKAEEGYVECLAIAMDKNDSALLSSAHGYLGSLYLQIEINDKAIYHLKEACKYINIEKQPDEAGKLYGRIGNFYLSQEYYDDAEQYYKRAITFFSINKTIKGIIIATQNLGVIEKRRKNYDKAISYYNQALKSYESINYIVGVGQCLANIGNIHSEKKEYAVALRDLSDALAIFKKTNQINDEMLCYTEICDLYNRQKDYGKAIETINKAKAYLDSIPNNDNTKLAVLHELHTTNRNLGNIDQAYQYLLEYQVLNDKLNDNRTKAKIETLRIQYEVEQKDKDLRLLTIENELKDARLKRNVRFQVLYLIIIGLSSLVIVSLFVLFRLKKIANVNLIAKNSEILQQKEEIEAQREEIEAQRDDLEIQRSIAVQQRDEITRQKKNITDSIAYAKHIQTAMLPNDSEVKLIIPEGFIFFKPLDIVSGDFYWVNQSNHQAVIAVADCTGHGVPGAFMSVMGINFLNSLVIEQGITNPGEVLTQLNQYVISALSHADSNLQDKDGMDISLCCVDRSKMEMQYSCAKIRILIWRKGEIIQLESNKYSIGKSPFVEKITFDTSSIPICKDDMIYLMSDGYVDQFGGKDRIKFLASRFKKLLLEIAHLDPGNQEKIISKTINDWQGSYPQVDDMLIVGFRV